MIYFDNNASTMVAQEVFDAMKPFLTGEFGNPSSGHAAATMARMAIAQARENVAEMLGAADPSEIVFTSGGTESDNWAILGALELQPGKKHIVTTAVEHEAVRKLCEKLEKQGCEVTWLGVDEQGELDLGELKKALRPDTAIVSIMTANNQTGVIFPVAEVAGIVKENSDALFHTDGVNAAGKMPIDLKNTQIDMMSISGTQILSAKRDWGVVHTKRCRLAFLIDRRRAREWTAGRYRSGTSDRRARCCRGLNDGSYVAWANSRFA